MLAQEEIEKAKGWLSALDIKSEFEAISKEIISQYIEQLEEIKGMKETIELAGMDIKSLLKFKYENERLKNKVNQLEQENKKLKHTNKSYKGIINKQSEGKKNTIKELNKRMCNFADTLEPETILKYGEIKMEDIDNNTYELLAVYTLGLLGDIYKIVKEEF